MTDFFKKKDQEKIDKVFDRRILFLAMGIFIFGLIIIAKLFSLQVIQHDFYTKLATKRQEVYKDLLAERGTIYSKEGGELFPLVTNREYFFAYAEPVKIKDTKKFIDTVTSILGLSEEEWKDVLNKINKTGDPFEPIKHKITKQQVEQIEALGLTGIGFIPEVFRFYPEKDIGGHIFGFVKTEDDDKQVGQYGIEGYFNEELSGKSGLLQSVKDALGSLITVGPRKVEKAQDGSDIVLTIDRNIQFTACEKLKFYHDYFKAAGGTVIIMEPAGKILAMCSFPDFDSEKFNEVEDINNFNNPAIFYPYEPGSVFKMITMAAGLDLEAIEPDTTYVDEGEVKVGPYTIRNSDLKAHGEQTMTYVLEQSLNTGAIFVEQKIGKENFIDYVNKFGFGQPTHVQLDSEVSGDLSSLDKKGDIFAITASFGQGITATPIQLITAFAAVANQGKLPKPYIVSEIIDSEGKVTETKEEVIRQVVSPKAASLISGMLVSVAEKGYDNKARVPGYYLAGKTGTAQIATPGGGYGADTIHTFIGYGPVSSPRFVIFVKLDKPQGIRFASDSIAPLFRQLSEYLISYYQIPPEY